MSLSQQIETPGALALRDRRQHFAAPGGSHDRLVHFLAPALPMGVGGVVALLVVTPLSPRGEVGFLLDRTKADRKIDVSGKVVSVVVCFGGCRLLQNKIY